MEFEYDPEKSRANADKHGIDFLQAQQMWDDPDLLLLPARSASERRWLALGLCEGRLWAAIFTLRSGRIRLISVRRARAEESSVYQEA
jgi:uncharacterized protein